MHFCFGTALLQDDRQIIDRNYDFFVRLRSWIVRLPKIKFPSCLATKIYKNFVFCCYRGNIEEKPGSQDNKLAQAQSVEFHKSHKLFKHLWESGAVTKQTIGAGFVKALGRIRSSRTSIYLVFKHLIYWMKEIYFISIISMICFVKLLTVMYFRRYTKQVSGRGPVRWPSLPQEVLYSNACKISINGYFSEHLFFHR